VIRHVVRTGIRPKAHSINRRTIDSRFQR
jgi:hypothetical protein